MKKMNIRLHALWPVLAILIVVAQLRSPAFVAASPSGDAPHGDVPQAVALVQSSCAYTVRQGDTLSSIGARYNATVYDLAQWNGLDNPNRIYAGMALRVPCEEGNNPPGHGDGTRPSGICSYTLVRPRDNLKLIAARFGTTWQAIAQINRLYNPNLIYVGMRLAIPCGPGPGADRGQWKTFTSARYHYVINYPTNWTINVQAPGANGAGGHPEYVYLRPAATGLPKIEIYALKGAPPITGFENCYKNLVFRDTLACSISLPKGQIPATQLLIFQKGDSHYQLSMEYEVQQQLAVFEEVVKSFRFTP